MNNLVKVDEEKIRKAELFKVQYNIPCTTMYVFNHYLRILPHVQIGTHPLHAIVDHWKFYW